MMLASFEHAFRLQQRDANTKKSKDTVLESDDSRFVGCLTITRDNALLPTPAKYECQAPKIWVPRDQPVSGSSLFRG